MEKKKIKEKESEENEKIRKEVTERFNQIKKLLPSPFKMDIYEIKALIKSDNDKCIICQQGYKVENEVLKLKCSHLFHKECIVRWLIENNKCPMCKEYCFEEPYFNEMQDEDSYLQLRNLWLRENLDRFLMRRFEDDDEFDYSSFDADDDEIEINYDNYEDDDDDDGEERFI